MSAASVVAELAEVDAFEIGLHNILLYPVLRLLAVGNDVFTPDHNACCFMFAIIPS